MVNTEISLSGKVTDLAPKIKMLLHDGALSLTVSVIELVDLILISCLVQSLVFELCYLVFY